MQDEQLVAFHDHHPAARIHILVVPKQHIFSTRHLRNSQEDKELCETLHKLIRLRINQEGQNEFHFHLQEATRVCHDSIICSVTPFMHVPFFASMCC